MLDVTPVRAFADNYIWMLRAGSDASRVAIVDPGDAGPVLAEIGERGWTPAAILLTHHHWDHTGGVGDLLEHFDVPVYGPDNPKIHGITHVVRDGDEIDVADMGLRFRVIAVPGHTLDHIAYIGHDAVFCGDTLFSAGCGKLFEGTAEQMQSSLSRLRGLHDRTRVYCAHEYTAANLAFAHAVDPANDAIDDYIEYAGRLTALGYPTLPSHMALEKRVNPFLRWDDPAVREAAARQSDSPLATAPEIFGALRAWKDRF